MPDTLTIEDLPFDPTIDDAEPDDHADAVFDEASEIAGLHVRLLIGITEYAYQHADDKAALDALKTVFHWNPKHLIKAYERFEDVFGFNGDGVEWHDIVGCWMLGKVKDDETAQKLYNEWHGYTWDLAQLRDAVKAANGKRERAPSLAERCAELVRTWDAESDEQPNPYAGEPDNGDLQARSIFRVCANALSVLPEVAKALEAKNGKEK